MSVTREDVIDFVYAETRMLDEGRYNEWLALWMADGHYWMPLDYKQSDPHLVTSLMYEDLFMLKLRVERLNGARTFSQKPKSRCHHVIQRPFVDVFEPTKGISGRILRCTMSKRGWTTRSCWH